MSATEFQASLAVVEIVQVADGQGHTVVACGVPLTVGEIRCRERLSGLLKSNYWEAV